MKIVHFTTSTEAVHTFITELNGRLASLRTDAMQRSQTAALKRDALTADARANTITEIMEFLEGLSIEERRQ